MLDYYCCRVCDYKITYSRFLLSNAKTAFAIFLLLFNTLPLSPSLYFFFDRFPSPFFGGPFPRLFILSNFTFLRLSSGSSNNASNL